MYNNLIVDTSNLFYRAYCIVDDPNESFIKVSQMVNNLILHFASVDHKVYFLYDNYTSIESYRKKIDPDYKLNRTKKDTGFYRLLDLLQTMLLNSKSNYYVVQVPGYEADDLVKPLLSLLEGTSVLLSQDSDWSRSIDTGVDWAPLSQVNPSATFNTTRFQAEFGFFPSEDTICFFKTIRGDKKDNVPCGCPSISQVNLIQLIEQFGTIPKMLEGLSSAEYLTPHMMEKLRDSKPRLLLNYQLVSFQDLKKDDLEPYIFTGKFSPGTLKTLYDSLSIPYEKIDPRLCQYYPKQAGGIPAGKFFQFKKTPRA